MMSKETIDNWRQDAIRLTKFGVDTGPILGACLQEIESLQSRIAELEKERNDLLSIVVNVDDHLISMQSLKRKIDEVRKRMDYELPTVADVQSAYAGMKGAS